MSTLRPEFSWSGVERQDGDHRDTNENTKLWRGLRRSSTEQEDEDQEDEEDEEDEDDRDTTGRKKTKKENEEEED